MALVFCPSAFRLRRLAQNVGRGLGLRHFTCTVKFLVTCQGGFRLRIVRLTSVAQHFPRIFRIK
jgi:hypothetical protein